VLFRSTRAFLSQVAAARYSQARIDAIRALGQLAAQHHAQFMVVAGDVFESNQLSAQTLSRALDALNSVPVPVFLLPGNHDHPSLLRAALGRQAVIAPAAIDLGDWRLLLLDTHRAGRVDGELGPDQLVWLQQQLQAADRPLLVALHHPPVPIGHSVMDGIALQHPAALLELLVACPWLRAVTFGHIHQHWQGLLPGRPDVQLLGCPSTHRQFEAVQACPLGRAGDPGGRIWELAPAGRWQQHLRRWPATAAATGAATPGSTPAGEASPP
jgi:Icc protein